MKIIISIAISITLIALTSCQSKNDLGNLDDKSFKNVEPIVTNELNVSHINKVEFKTVKVQNIVDENKSAIPQQNASQTIFTFNETNTQFNSLEQAIKPPLQPQQNQHQTIDSLQSQKNSQQQTIEPLQPSNLNAPNPQLALQTLRQAQLQQLKQKEQLLQEQSKLKNWITQQLQTFKQQNQAIVTQSFQFVLDPQESYTMRWNPPKTQSLRLSILVFQVLQNGEIMLEQDLEQTQYIKIQTREQGKTTFNYLGHVYISRVFRIDFDTDFKYFRFTSSLPREVFVVVDLQKLHEVIPSESIAKDQHFLAPLNKLRAIEEEVKSGEKIREHTYKYEWGFLDNQFSHDSRLLGFTGFELVIIIGAALTQLYFIKTLLDNRAIV